MSSKEKITQKGDDFVVNTAEKVFFELLGEPDGTKVSPQFLKNRTLTVSCLSSTVAEAIRTRQQEIVDLINSRLGKSEVDRIRYLL